MNLQTNHLLVDKRRTSDKEFSRDFPRQPSLRVQFRRGVLEMGRSIQFWIHPDNSLCNFFSADHLSYNQLAKLCYYKLGDRSGRTGKLAWRDVMSVQPV
jgi:hypothetical protein